MPGSPNVTITQHRRWCSLHFIFFYKFFGFFLAVLGLHFCVLAFSSCGEQRLLFVVAHTLLIAVASLVAEHGL